MLVLLGCFIRAKLALELELMPTFVLQIQILRCRQGVGHILTLGDFAHRKIYRFTENKPQTLMSKLHRHWLWATAFSSSSPPPFLSLLHPCFSQSISLPFPSHCSVGLSEDCNLWGKLTSPDVLLLLMLSPRPEEGDKSCSLRAVTYPAFQGPPVEVSECLTAKVQHG